MLVAALRVAPAPSRMLPVALILTAAVMHVGWNLMLVLVAMRLTQVTYVAALREVSVVLAAVVGWRLLGEPFGARRVAGAALAAAGLVALGVTMAR